jgi:pyruvate,orthophosphate dikinase
MSETQRKMVYSFGGGSAEGDAQMRNLLGGKGANLAEMARIGLPVPAGFTITTEVCRIVSETGEFPEGIEAQIDQAIAQMEKVMDATFGDATRPLLLSVRSGARVSMPGMMDTVLNLGLNPTIVEGLQAHSGNAFFANDCYRRFTQMYGDVVLGLRPEHEHELDPFELLLEEKKQERGVSLDHELTAEDMMALAQSFQAKIKERTGHSVPEDPKEQLWSAIRAVFSSWNNERAQSYRAINHIPDNWGTAVNVQAMVFGNRNPDCGTGVAFTRNPSMGQNVLYGEFLMNAQGEDVVAGVRTPQPLSLAEKERTGRAHSLEEDSPSMYQQLKDISDTLETHFRDMQDLEFTIEEGKLWILQTRTGKRTGMAAIKMAVDMVDEGLITSHEALSRIDPSQHLGHLLQPLFPPEEQARAKAEGRIVAVGLAAGPGAATGRLVFSAQDAEAWTARGEHVILARIETSPEDIRGMAIAEGILTARGGATSHAALVARQMGKVCVAGCDALDISYAHRQMRVGGKLFKEGDWLSLDGFQGNVIAGRMPTRPSEVIQVLLEQSLDPADAPLYQLYEKLMSWANEARTLHVRCNADQPEQVRIAKAFGAEGVGLCRTEHMFFGGDRITHVRKMILAETDEVRQEALAKLLPLQEDDFVQLFREMSGFPVTIRLLDPPLHEFIPTRSHEIEDLAHQLSISVTRLERVIEKLVETNPMLGHRGCRLLISYPAIAEMQVKAIIGAALRVQAEGLAVQPKIMIPLVSMADELRLLRGIVERVANEMFTEHGSSLPYAIGTMIELPRACVTAHEISRHADFFSFGTNDLTQTSYGFSRDDAGKFLDHYKEHKLLQSNPFQSLDREGVGALMRIATEGGKASNPSLTLGICGEHGGDPGSIAFCHQLGLNDVSCSPYRIPVAILAAAQAALPNE